MAEILDAINSKDSQVVITGSCESLCSLRRCLSTELSNCYLSGHSQVVCTKQITLPDRLFYADEYFLFGFCVQQTLGNKTAEISLKEENDYENILNGTDSLSTTSR